jgi:hypothetical protein
MASELAGPICHSKPHLSPFVNVLRKFLWAPAPVWLRWGQPPLAPGPRTYVVHYEAPTPSRPAPPPLPVSMNVHKSKFLLEFCRTASTHHGSIDLCSGSNSNGSKCIMDTAVVESYSSTVVVDLRLSAMTPMMEGRQSSVAPAGQAAVGPKAKQGGQVWEQLRGDGHRKSLSVVCIFGYWQRAPPRYSYHVSGNMHM